MFTKLMEMYRKYKEIILYVFFGGLATVVSIGSFAWCDVVMHMDPLVAEESDLVDSGSDLRLYHQQPVGI